MMMQRWKHDHSRHAIKPYYGGATSPQSASLLLEYAFPPSFLTVLLQQNLVQLTLHIDYFCEHAISPKQKKIFLNRF